LLIEKGNYVRIL
jgi:hypothetical protein